MTLPVPAASRVILSLLLAGCLVACGGRARAERRDPPYQLSANSCLQALALRGVAVEPWTPPSSSGSCRVGTPVRARAGITAPFATPLETSCAMLLAWTDIEPAVQEAARTYMGSTVASVRHFGSFGCRSVKGNASRVSLHASARALDIAGFRLANGRVVTVKEDWNGSSSERRFLRAVRDAACKRASLVLSPDADKNHQDHIHLDLGPWRLCE